MKTTKSISVVTVCYNAQNLIEKTIQSVIEQNFADKEYIVIDGYSNDKTNQIIDKYRNKIDIFVSEPDSGIYNAMNKAVDLVSGDWIIFMNAGDTFAEKDVLTKVRQYLNDKTDVVYGNILKKKEDLLILKEAHKEIREIHRMPFCHQAVFTRTTLLKRYHFDEKYRLSSDFKFYKELINNGISFNKIDTPIAIYDHSGLSNTQRVKAISENIAIIKEVDNIFIQIKLLPRLYFVKYWNILRKSG